MVNKTTIIFVYREEFMCVCINYNMIVGRLNIENSNIKNITVFIIRNVINLTFN